MSQLEMKSPLSQSVEQINGSFCQYRNDRFYQIENYDQMANFFMSIVSAYDHWLFISSNGGLTAGRQNSTKSFFPYYTEDKLADMAHCTGSITLLKEGGTVWQAFNPVELTPFTGKRNLLKSAVGDQLFFQEVYNDLVVEYGWSFSDEFGLVKTTRITNRSDKSRTVEVLDGMQNILPASVDPDQQSMQSVLLDAYKSVDLYDNNVATYALSSRLSDRAEPSEALLANTVWHALVEGKAELITSINPEAPKQFGFGQPIATDSRVRGKRGYYFVNTELNLAAGESVEWITVGEVYLNGSQINALRQRIKAADITAQVQADIKVGQQQLNKHLAKTDGFQLGSEEETTVHHTANTLFNIMRGGLFEDGYSIDSNDLRTFVAVRNIALADHEIWSKLPAQLEITDLPQYVEGVDSLSLKRLISEYLPISFSRRHGDPSRPWNKFSINLKDANGNPIKDYQGNWRDIFQNWEPLAFSYPEFLPAMISNFLNATTGDGYNPYRMTRQGIEWEEPEEDNPWANIGYWSDHQIIYLAKLLELQGEFKPEVLAAWLTEKRFSYANIPYRIKPFAALQQDPHNSIDFDDEANAGIHKLAQSMGSDAKLILDSDGEVVHVSLMEKLLTLWLAKLSNFVPGGGIWMNTQKPEWNDANNALVGWGLSVVTLGYLHRHLGFMKSVLEKQTGEFPVSQNVQKWFEAVAEVFAQTVDAGNAKQRYSILSALAQSSDEYRSDLYQNGMAQSSTLSFAKVVEFLDNLMPLIRESLVFNKREDGLYHAYNLLDLRNGEAHIDYLPQMLEGQVSILSAGLLSAEETLAVYKALRHSDLYRADQHTYLLYPNKQLDLFLDKNNVDADAFSALSGAEQLLGTKLFHKDQNGVVHFNADLRNAADLRGLMASEKIAESQQAELLSLYEQTFNHKEFTGRSGSFFGYEGLGSTYWHMVSKLLLAVQENWYQAVAEGKPVELIAALKDAYYDVRAGIGFNKSPAEYGAFPTDPYSHTPETNIARQPGMTGQVKEELITRLGELGVVWRNGTLVVIPGLLRAEEFTRVEGQLAYLSIDEQWQTLTVPADSVAFTLAQVPFVLRKSTGDNVVLTIQYSNGEQKTVSDGVMPKAVFTALQNRDGSIAKVEIEYPIAN